MLLPRRAKLVIASAFAAGLLTLGIAIDKLTARGWLGSRATAILAVFTVLVVVSWLWPIVMYRNTESESLHLDEGFFVIMALLLPASATIIGFAAAMIIAQVVRRRPLVKSVFNFGQVLTAVGLGLTASRLLAPPTRTITMPEVGAAAAGAIVFFVVNSLALAAIMTAIGTPWRQSVREGLEIRALLVGAGLTVGLITALAISADAASLPLAVLPLLILRQVLAGHFEARHDRTRLHGLFEATLEANRTMGDDDVTAPILASACELLRCSDAAITVAAPGPDQMGAAFVVDGQEQWLVVSGRSRTEPFDAADEALLYALAAVGAGALANASLYQEGRRQRDRLSAITSSLGEGVCALDTAGRVTFINPAGAHMLGWSEVLGDMTAPNFLLVPALRAMETGDTLRNDDTIFERADGTVAPVAFTASAIVTDGEVVGAAVAFRDITERKVFEGELARHAFHDALTGLANRRLFIDHLDHALRRSERSGETHAVLFVDIDRFKIINDSLGHHAGDQLLIAIAARMRAALRPGDILARFGGDEFTLLLEGVSGVSDAVAAVERILGELKDPIALAGGHEVTATLSVGIALTSQGKSRDDILHDADVAMYQAKAKGHTGHYEIFDIDAMGARSAERVDLEAALRRAIEREELDVYYQPLFSVTDGAVVGAEALVRWNHPERGLLLPAHFITLAEETGLILPLGRLVLDQACRRARGWRDRYGVELSMAINLSARQFQHAGLIDEIEQILRTTEVVPRQICLEITETLAMQDVERSSAVLGHLKKLGVRLAIDDFGTGYSSLGYLKQFPVDVVKIDRSFVDGLDVNPVDSAIVAAVIGLARAVGMTTVAEGVETRTQLDHLRSLGCPIAQGFLLAQPLSGAAMEQFLSERAETLAPAFRPAHRVLQRLA